jgi:DNA-binding NarL/FixJ family response regulator
MLKGLNQKTRAKGKPQFDHSVELTKREMEILGLICKELTTPEIAEKLFISNRTVEGHRKNLLEKTGAKNTAGLVVFALKNELVEI